MMNAIPSRSFLSLSRQRALLRGRPALRLLLLVAGILAIIAWQGTFRDNADRLSDRYSISNTFGGEQSAFAYFFHYLGLYPVEIRGGLAPGASREAAQETLRNHGNRLHMGETYDRLTVLSYVPDIYMGGDPLSPSHSTAAWIGFTTALIALYASLWTARLEFFGIALVALLGSDPFQLHEVYAQDNVFGWNITIGILIAAINLPLIVNHRYYLTSGGKTALYLWLAPLLSGAVLGTFRHLRTECVTTMAATMAAYVLLSGIGWRRKGALIAVLVGVFVITQSGWNAYFDRIETRSANTVRAAGGSVANDLGDLKVHVFWHPLWGGLGDFDGKYGYLFWDRVMIDYAAPTLVKRPGWDPGTKMAYQDAYAEILREKMLSDIARDPLWYASIIVKRLNRVLFENTPPRLAVGSSWVDIPVLQKLLLPFGLLALACYLVRKEWSMPRLLLFPFAMGGVAVAVSTVNGYQYYATVHLFLYALFFAWALETLLRLAERGRSKA